jgi:NADP-dependent 3-hydroxy acid dehydrogenase YdfG
MQKVMVPDWRIALVTGASKGTGRWISRGARPTGVDLGVVTFNLQDVEYIDKEIGEVGQRSCSKRPLKYGVSPEFLGL